MKALGYGYEMAEYINKKMHNESSRNNNENRQ